MSSSSVVKLDTMTVRAHTAVIENDYHVTEALRIIAARAATRSSSKAERACRKAGTRFSGLSASRFCHILGWRLCASLLSGVVKSCTPRLMPLNMVSLADARAHLAERSQSAP